MQSPHPGATPAGPWPDEGPTARPRVAIVCGEHHLDHDLAFVSIVARHADVLVCGPGSAGGEALRRAGAAETALFAWPRHRQAGRNLKLLAELAATIRRFRPEVVHLLSEGQVWLNLLPLMVRPTPLVVTLHDVDPHPGDRDTRKVPRALVNLCVRQASTVLVHGEGLKARAVQRLGLDPDRIFVGVHPPITRYAELAREAGFGKPGDRVFRTLFFGRIFAYKGLEHLIAAEPLIGSDVAPRLTVVAGRGEGEDAYRRAIAAPERFDLRFRRIEDLEAARLFAEADVLALPYVEASQSGVLAIAAAFGLPVVASDVGEIGRLVRASGMGLVVPPADPPALADALRTLAQEPARREACADNARRALDDALGEGAVWSAAARAYALAARRRAD